MLIRWLGITGGLATLLTAGYQYIFYWIPLLLKSLRNFDPAKDFFLRDFFFAVIIPVLVIVFLIGSFLYFLRESERGFKMLAIGAGLLAIPCVIIVFLFTVILGSRDWLGALSVAAPGICAVITFLLAFYNKRKYENTAS